MSGSAKEKARSLGYKVRTIAIDVARYGVPGLTVGLIAGLIIAIRMGRTSNQTEVRM